MRCKTEMTVMSDIVNSDEQVNAIVGVTNKSRKDALSKKSFFLSWAQFFD
jgi:hypothetical protein